MFTSGEVLNRNGDVDKSKDVCLTWSLETRRKGTKTEITRKIHKVRVNICTQIVRTHGQNLRVHAHGHENAHLEHGVTHVSLFMYFYVWPGFLFVSMFLVLRLFRYFAGNSVKAVV